MYSTGITGPKNEFMYVGAQSRTIKAHTEQIVCL